MKTKYFDIPSIETIENSVKPIFTDRVIKDIRQKPLNQWTTEDFQVLENAGIINWVWNNIIPFWLRWIMTQLFFYLDFKIHDANYWLIEDMPYREREIARKKADFGILKYAFLSPIKPIEYFSLSWIIIKDVLSILLVVIKFWLSMLTLPIAIIAYIAIRFLGSKSFK